MLRIEDLKGETISGLENREDEIIFALSSGEVVRMYHDQDCCEDVYVDDVNGEWEDLIGNPLLMAEEVTEEGEVSEGDVSITWTFYKLATKKGTVVIRWFGTSNGYYSESVDLEYITREDD